MQALKQLTKYYNSNNLWLREEFSVEKGLDVSGNIASTLFETYHIKNIPADEQFVVRTMLIGFYSELTDQLNTAQHVHRYANRHGSFLEVQKDGQNLTMIINRDELPTLKVSIPYYKLIDKPCLAMTEKLAYNEMSEQISKNDASADPW